MVDETYFGFKAWMVAGLGAHGQDDEELAEHAVSAACSMAQVMGIRMDVATEKEPTASLYRRETLNSEAQATSQKLLKLCGGHRQF